MGSINQLLLLHRICAHFLRSLPCRARPALCQDIGWRESEDCNITVPTSSPETCYTLARAYHYGKSAMPQDKKYALELYREAAINGHKKSKRAYEELKTILSTDPLKNEKPKYYHKTNLISPSIFHTCK